MITTAAEYARGGPGCGLLVLLLIGGLVAAGWWLLRRRRTSGPAGDGTASSSSPAEDLLTERYARGDISDEEYWQRLSVIRESRSGSGSTAS